MLDELKNNNRAWAARKIAADPGFFRRLEGQQAPQYLWIGCSDSRVPANEIVGAALSLASDAASFTNGAMLKVDGGPVRARASPLYGADLESSSAR